MRKTRTTTALSGVALVLVALTLGACGDDGTDTTDTAGAESATPDAATGTDDQFCGLARSWQVHELVEPDYEDPVAFAAYWPEYVAFVEASHAVAPDEIADTWDTYAAVVAGMTEVFERYEFDGERFEAEGTPEEQEVIEPTDAALLAVKDAVLAFESERCGTIQPAAADVSFAAEQAGAYCDAIRGGVRDLGRGRCFRLRPGGHRGGRGRVRCRPGGAARLGTRGHPGRRRGPGGMGRRAAAAGPRGLRL